MNKWHSITYCRKESNRAEYTYICSFNIPYTVPCTPCTAKCLVFRSNAGSLQSQGEMSNKCKYSTPIYVAVVCKLLYLYIFFCLLFIFILNFILRCVGLPIAMANRSHKSAACNESTNHAKCKMITLLNIKYLFICLKPIFRIAQKKNKSRCMLLIAFQFRFFFPLQNYN